MKLKEFYNYIVNKLILLYNYITNKLILPDDYPVETTENHEKFLKSIYDRETFSSKRNLTKLYVLFLTMQEKFTQKNGSDPIENREFSEYAIKALVKFSRLLKKIDNIVIDDEVISRLHHLIRLRNSIGEPNYSDYDPESADELYDKHMDLYVENMEKIKEEWYNQYGKWFVINDEFDYKELFELYEDLFYYELNDSTANKMINHSLRVKNHLDK